MMTEHIAMFAWSWIWGQRLAANGHKGAFWFGVMEMFRNVFKLDCGDDCTTL